ncbi:cryptochrome-1 [Leguminivora glycinivorella]|uniref:cryptochrome-1 n=1 Tax=Leguminivora glycinivorella TaxID=1035111 RepID=UPI00200D8423|nr:cryptochrome-1 [Leguminivora glycinivorella]XP_047986230.1 cryptochrome-1 [Leguminivora glycinivorella]XP_047986231.1 cryptochrome-1 [Leguminivora glycinivorella]
MLRSIQIMARATPAVIHWFRLDLRVHDNLALRNAINEAENRKYYLRPIYIIDPDIKDKIGVNRLRFLVQSLQDLDDNLKKLNTRLYIIKGKAEEKLPELFDKWQVKNLTLQLDIDPELARVDDIIEKIAEKKEIFVVKRVQHTVYDCNRVLTKNNGSVPMTYQKFLSLASEQPVKACIEINKQISDSCRPLDHDSQEYDVPNLSDLGIDESSLCPCKYVGGETEGLKRLDMYMARKEWVCKFEKPNSFPNSLEPSTTVLSPYISHGCVSAKLFYNKLKEVENGRRHTEPPVSLMGQLMWREFYYTAGTGTENFDKMVGNPLCIQIPWVKNEAHLKAWAEGRTGFPFVDAIMRQLKQEGWIHHLARHMVACFLTRGDLWISWEEGAKVFEDYLLDYDWSLNAGNWMWLSASAFFYKYFRVYSPVAFGKKTDKEGEYIKKYVPELAKYPEAFIYEPWKAPKEVQRRAGCVVGEGYPKRIVEHDKIHKDNMAKMNAAYKANKEKKEKKSLKRKRTDD